MSCRLEAAESAAQAGAALVAVGTPVLQKSDQEQVTAKDRYERIVHEFGEISRQGSVCGMHVHVDVADDEEGVTVIDGLRPWLPVLRAMSVNSPYWRGTDTGYASWRTQVWARWPTAGPSDPFGDPAGYRAVTEALVASGAALDVGMLYLDARLAQAIRRSRSGCSTPRPSPTTSCSSHCSPGRWSVRSRPAHREALPRLVHGGTRCCGRPIGGRPATASLVIRWTLETDVVSPPGPWSRPSSSTFARRSRTLTTRGGWLVASSGS